MKRLLVFFIFITFYSCTGKVDIDDLTGTWELVKVVSDKDVKREKDNIYTLRFDMDGSVVLNLDVNECYSHYTLKDDNKIIFGSFPCTRVCCDTDYADEFYNIVRTSTKVFLWLDILTLEGKEGKAVLKRK